MFDFVSSDNTGTATSKDLILIDSQVANYRDLIAGVEDAEAIAIDSRRDGIEQITKILSQYENISSLQIVSHGSDGLLQIGNSNLSLENIEDYREQLQQWSQYLNEDADILLWGCKVGSDRTFLESLQELTNADIAASDDLTGYEDLNGDWQLEINLGTIESELKIDEEVLTNYDSVLAISESELIVKLDFNDRTGNIARDSAPDSNNDLGRLARGANFSQDDEPFAGVVTLDGRDDFIAIASTPELNLADRSERTISLWFKADNIDRSTPQILYQEGGVGRGLNIYLDRGELYVGGWNQPESRWSGTYLDSSNVSSNTWHHVALVLDAQSNSTAIQPDVLFAYLDGVEIGRGSGSQVWDSGGNVTFGGLNGGTRLHTGNIKSKTMFGFLGAIDEAKIYNRALSATEIATLADFDNLEDPDSPNPPTPPTSSDLLVAQLNLDETGGNRANDSQRDNDGILRNGATFVSLGADLGGGVRFDGNNDFMAIASSPDINLDIYSQRTISLWFNADNLNSQSLQVLYEEGGGGRGLNIYLDRGELYIGGWNQPESRWSGTYLNSDRVTENTWHHVALVLDAQPGSTVVQSDVLFAYLDGVEIARGSGSQLWTHGGGIGLGGINGSTKTHRGNFSGSNNFAGDIASLEIYNQALNSQAIANLAALETPETPQNPNPPVVVEPPTTSRKFTADNQLFNYDGRIDYANLNAPALGFPGTSVEFRFRGTKLQIELSEDNWGRENYVDVYIDNNPQPVTIKLRREGGNPVVYDIAEGLENKVHNVTIYKRNDFITGEFRFHGIIIDGQLLQPNPDSQRTIEIYGDSITSAEAVEHPVTGVQDPPGNNNDISNAYYSYGSILARDYNAEVSLVSQSGASLVNGFGFWNTFWNNGTGGEAIYDKVKPLSDSPLWDFNNYDPDLVIVAYGQNDSATVGNQLSKQQWKQRYKQFIGDLRAKHPDAYFIGMFPSMFHDRRWDDYITEAIAEYRQENNDERIFSLIHPQVTPGHPRISEQEAMAETLRDFIDGTLTDNGFNWN